MSGWVVGKISSVEELTGTVQLKVVERGPVRVKVEWTQHYKSTELHQSVAMTQHGPPEFSLHTEWKELGSDKGDSPFLKVAFDTNLTSPTATYDLPFGNITRPRGDTGENAALKWVDASDTTCGVALLNDCKHGYTMKDNVLRLSLIRSSYSPDPRPNDRPQTARYMLLPHSGDWREGKVIQTAFEFNKPLWVTTATATRKRDANLPPDYSFVHATTPDVFITGLKQAEDDKDLIVRAYEGYGAWADNKFEFSMPAKSAKRVNFVEDDLTSEGAADAPMRPYEIRTLKVKM
jgi:alpha-mannosidase